jgi:hypothetical protein
VKQRSHERCANNARGGGGFAPGMVKTESLAAVRGAPKESSGLNFVAGTAGVHWPPPLPESKHNAHPAPTGDVRP